MPKTTQVGSIGAGIQTGSWTPRVRVYCKLFLFLKGKVSKASKRNFRLSTGQSRFLPMTPQRTGTPITKMTKAGSWELALTSNSHQILLIVYLTHSHTWSPCPVPTYVLQAVITTCCKWLPDSSLPFQSLSLQAMP